ncbi:MAG: T9SS type A sorting domain-containing protein [Bacteroidetes bacterium]|nr:T9SS type A sorting domain-containing protein [Bacteroidota bacterium]
MKKILVILLFSFSGITAQSQQYNKFPTDTAVWNCLYFWNGNPNPAAWHYTNYSYIMDGDTIIKAKQYKKMYYKDEVQNARVYICGLREDTMKHIYLFPRYNYIISPSHPLFPNDSSEQLLYSFNNLKVGDSIAINPGNNSISVISIDSVLLGSKFRKRYQIYYTKFAQQDYWIEGIGSTKELFFPYTYEFEFTLNTMCYHDTLNYLINPPSGITSCQYITGISERKTVQLQIQLYPSPAQQVITLELAAIRQNSMIYIYDIQGKMLLKQGIKQTKEEIDISSFKSGLYLIKYSDDNESSILKFIKD